MVVSVITDFGLFERMRKGMEGEMRSLNSFREYKGEPRKSMLKQRSLFDLAARKAKTGLPKYSKKEFQKKFKFTFYVQNKYNDLHMLRVLLKSQIDEPTYVKGVLVRHMIRKFKQIVYQDRDPVITYLLNHYVDKSHVPCAFVQKWLRSNDFIRSIMKAPRVLPKISTRWAEYVTQCNIDKIIIPEVESTKCIIVNKTKIFEDKNNVKKDFIPTCYTYTQYMHENNFSFRQRCSYNIKYENWADAELVDKYILKMFDKTLIEKRTAHVQMEDAHGKHEISPEAANNVVLTEKVETSGEKMVSIGHWTQSTTEDIVGSFPEMVERWYPIDSFKWDTSTSQGADLASVKLPTDAIKGRTDNITFAPFYNHVYWRGDFDVRVEVNVNPFTVGQLQVSFYYEYEYDQFASVRDNIFSLSQCEHGIIDAGSNNSVDLSIGYRNHSVFLTANTQQDLIPYYMGTLKIKVLSKLVTGKENASISGQIFIKFKNCEFTGQISRNLTGSAQMESALLIGGAMKLLDTVAADRNRDNPPAVVPPSYVVPTASHSWSIGTQLTDPLHSLRLDGSGQCRHPTLVNNQFTTIYDLVRVFGLHTHDKYWKMTDKPGAALMTFNSDPTDFTVLKLTDPLTSFVLTPVQYISTMFAQWRGGLEWRFDFVATKFHTGRLLIAFFPNCRGTDSNLLNLNNAKSSYNVVFDLQESKTCTFRVPYIQDNPWTRRTHTMSGSKYKFTGGGIIKVFVLNSLSAPSTVVNAINILVYLRAAEGFEVAVPIQPCIGLATNLTYPNVVSQVVRPTNGTSYYLSTWSGFYGNQELVIRYGALAGDITAFDKKLMDFFYGDEFRKIPLYFQSNVPFEIRVSTSVVKYYHYFIIVYESDQYCAFAFEKAKDAADAWLLQRANDDKWKNNIAKWPGGTYTVKDSVALWVLTNDRMAESEMERMNPVGVYGSVTQLVSSNNGRQFYGENFGDIKDLCRRYQVYGEIDVPKSNLLNGKFAMFEFPVIPFGLDLDFDKEDKGDMIMGKCREGIIPLLLSGFRYFRGSLRFRILIPDQLSGKMWIQHRPDELFGSRRIKLSAIKTDTMAFVAHGYATYIQYSHVNNVVEFEVPFYQTGMFGLMQPTTVEALFPYVSLGTIIVGFDTSSELKLDSYNFEIYYSVGDDFAVNTFQGFYKVVDPTPISYWPKKNLQCVDEVDFEILPTANSEGLIEECKKKITNYIVEDNKKEIALKINEAANEAKVEIEKSSLGTNLKMLILNILSHLGQVINNCTRNTLVLSIVGIFACLGIIITDVAGIVSNFVSLVCNKLGFSFKQDQSNECSASSQSGEEDEIKYQWVSAIYTGICGVIGYKACAKSDASSLEKWKRFLSKELELAMRAGNTMIRFITSHFKLIKRIVAYIGGKVCPDKLLINYYFNNTEVIKLWIDECMYLDRVARTEEILNNEILVERLHYAEAVGCQIVHDMLDIDLRHGVGSVNLIAKYHDKMVKLVEEQKSAGQYPFLRIKPLHVQFCGKPGIGKTKMVKAVGRFILHEICGEKIDNKPNLFCFVGGSSKYWDQCVGQPILVMDDIWAVNLPNTLESVLSNYFAVYSDSPFSPPKAECELKKMRYAPHVFLSTTNNPQQTFPDVNENALKRRRDVLIEAIPAELDPIGHPDCPHCGGSNIETVEAKHFEDFHHLNFYVLNKFGIGGDEALGFAQDRTSGVMTYLQLKAFLKRELTPKYKANRSAYQAEIEAMKLISPINVSSLQERIEDFHIRLEQRIGERNGNMWKEMFDSNANRFRKYWNNILPSKFQIPTSSGLSMLNEPADIDEIVNVGTSESCISEIQLQDLFEKYGIDKNLQIQGKMTMLIALLRKEWLEEKGVNSLCVHGTEDLSQYNYVNGKFFIDDKEILDKPCDKNCIMGSDLYLVIMERWLNYFPSRKLIIDRHSGGKFQDMNVPSIFRIVNVNESSRIIKLLKSIFSGILTVMNGIKKGVYYVFEKVWSTVKTIFGFINKWKIIFYPIIILIGSYFAASNVSNKYFGTYSNQIADYAEKHNDVALGIYEDTLVTRLQRQAEPGDIESIRDEYREKMKNEFYDRYHKPLYSSPEGKHYGEDTLRVGAQEAVKIAKTQSGMTADASNAERMVRKNSIILKTSFIDSSGRSRYMNFRGLMLYERRCLLQRHYLEVIDNAEKVECTFHFAEPGNRMNGCESGIRVNIKECMREYMCYEKGERDSNFVIVDLPLQINCFKNITKHFATQRMHRYVKNNIIFVRPGESSLQLPLKRGGGVLINALPDNRFSQNIRLSNTYEYSMSARGLCGSVILDPTLDKPIIGMHVAGMNSYYGGIAEVLCFETFSPVPCKKTPIVEICEMKTPDVDVSLVDIDTIIYVKGTVDSQNSSSQSEMSRIKPSLLHDEILPVETQPMPLHRNDPRMDGKDPLSLGCSKHGLLSRDFPPEILDRATHHYMDKLLFHVKPLRDEIGVLSLQEACCGIEECPDYKALQWSTSEGYPLVKLRPPNTKGKQWLFDLELLNNGYRLKGLHPILKRLLETQQALRKRGIRQDSVFMDCLKDETQPIEKANTIGKTRVFSTAPITFVIPFRQYFGDFMVAFRHNRIDTEHAIGINVDGPQWSQLARYITHHGEKIVAGDYSHFGYTLNSNVMGKAFDIMLAWYDKFSTSNNHEEDQIVRRVLASEIINCKRLARNLVYESACGIPSGFPATDIINSMVNCLYIRCAWLDLIREPLILFDRNCRLMTYGDDLMMGVSDKYISEFNTETMHDYFSKFEIKFTDITKDGQMIPYRKFSEVPFLKRTFVKHPTRPLQYLAKIDPISIGSALNWIHECDDLIAASVMNAEQALVLAYGHGPEYYNELRSKIKTNLEYKNIKFNAFSWLDRDIANNRDEVNGG